MKFKIVYIIIWSYVSIESPCSSFFSSLPLCEWNRSSIGQSSSIQFVHLVFSLIEINWEIGNCGKRTGRWCKCARFPLCSVPLILPFSLRIFFCFVVADETCQFGADSTAFHIFKVIHFHRRVRMHKADPYTKKIHDWTASNGKDEISQQRAQDRIHWIANNNKKKSYEKSSRRVDVRRICISAYRKETICASAARRHSG